mgnify:CR=1 FL=1
MPTIKHEFIVYTVIQPTSVSFLIIVNSLFSRITMSFFTDAIWDNSCWTMISWRKQTPLYQCTTLTKEQRYTHVQSSKPPELYIGNVLQPHN